jgi:hypothetical protein
MREENVGQDSHPSEPGLSALSFASFQLVGRSFSVKLGRKAEPDKVGKKLQVSSVQQQVASLRDPRGCSYPERITLG